MYISPINCLIRRSRPILDFLKNDRFSVEKKIKFFKKILVLFLLPPYKQLISTRLFNYQLYSSVFLFFGIRTVVADGRDGAYANGLQLVGGYSCFFG